MDTDSPVMRRLAVLGSIVTVAVASFAYSGAVSASAFFGFIVIAALGPGLLSALIGQPNQLGGLLAGLSGALGWSVAVNALSGELSGPVARSSFACGLGAACAVYSARRLLAPPFLAAILITLGGALYYGSAGEVRPLAVIVGAMAVATVALIDAARHRRRARRPSTAAVLVAAALCGLFLLAAVGAQGLVNSTTDKSDALTSPLVVAAAIQPLWSSSNSPDIPVVPTVPTTNEPDPSKTTTTRAGDAQNSASTPSTLNPTQPPVQEKKRRTLMDLILLLVLLVLVLLILTVAARFALGAYRLRRWKRRLQALPTAASTAAAWSWMVLLLTRLGWRTRANPSIDSMPEDMERLGWPDEVRAPAAEVATIGTAAAFSPADTSDDACAAAWRQAHEAVTAARAQSRSSQRARALLLLLRT